jgi:hypothetical protein
LRLPKRSQSAQRNEQRCRDTHRVLRGRLGDRHPCSGASGKARHAFGCTGLRLREAGGDAGKRRADLACISRASRTHRVHPFAHAALRITPRARAAAAAEAAAGRAAGL